MKRPVIIAVILAVAALIVYLLWPMSSRRHAIEYDEARKRRKDTFLREMRDRGLDEPPVNVIVIMADDLGQAEVSAYGYDRVPTPNIDALAAGGVLFEEAYCTAPICSPSRAGLLTGRYQQRYGFEVQPQNRYPRNRLEYLVFDHFIDTGNWTLVDLDSVPRQEDIDKQGVDPGEILLAELLSARGMATGMAGKWHLGFQPDFIPINRGFDSHYGFYEAFSLYAPKGKPGIEEYRHDIFAIEHQWEQGRSGTSAIRRNHKVIDEDEYLTFRIAEEAVDFMEKHRDDPFFLYVPFSAPHVPFQAPEEYYDRFSHIQEKPKRVYYAMISALDDAVGMITTRLRELGLEGKTLVIFASDNGGATYTKGTDNGNLKGGKFTNFEGGIRIPAAARWPGVIPAGQRFEHPVSLLDVFTTSAAVTHTPLPEDREFDGVNLIPWLKGTRQGAPHRALFWRSGYNRAVRMGPWKLILDDKMNRTQLYNMERDPGETRNLWREKPEVVKRLKQELERWEKGLREPLWPRVMDYRYIIDGKEYYFAL
jgi:arylsulfatase A-like enzyme